LFIFTFLSFLALIYLSTRQRLMTSAQNADLQGVAGKTILITGGTGGLGRETAIVLAKYGAKVIFTGRDEAKGKQAEQEMKQGRNDLSIEFRLVDFNSLENVRSFVGQITRENIKIDILINNAAITNAKFEKTVDGIESQMQVNHYAPFLLISSLIPQLREWKTRVIIVASDTYIAATNDFEARSLKPPPGRPSATYAVSKRANIYFSAVLNDKLKDSGAISVALHPGFIVTGLVLTITAGMAAPVAAAFSFLLNTFFRENINAGIQTILWLTVAKDIQGGSFYHDLKKMPLTKIVQQTIDEKAIPNQLWELSERLVSQNPKKKN